MYKNYQVLISVSVSVHVVSHYCRAAKRRTARHVNFSFSLLPLFHVYFLGNSGSSSPSDLGLMRQMVYTRNVAIEIHAAEGAMR